MADVGCIVIPRRVFDQPRDNDHQHEQHQGDEQPELN
jgi:hypothetical protein